MRGRVCLVTGSTSGIGRETAAALARLGATVGLVARDGERGERTLGEIAEASGNDQLQLFLCDLSSQAQVRALAARARERFDRLHVLVNNAGLVSGRRRLTEDGLELTFAVNHLAPFLLTNLLLDLLVSSAPSRIVTVTSGAQMTGRIRLDDLQGEHDYRGPRAYSQSKLANVLFTYELARRLEGTGVTANCVHPGAVHTNFGADATGFFGLVTRATRPLQRSPAAGADTVVWVASAPERDQASGEYLVKRRPRRSSRRSYDREFAHRLWEVSEQLTGTSADSRTSPSDARKEDS